MVESFDFYCTFCGKNFGENIIGLARHIGKAHNPPRK